MTSTPKALFNKIMSFKSPKNTTLNKSQLKVKKSFKCNILPINIILMGDNNTGKSAFLSRGQEGFYDQEVKATIGSTFTSRKYQVQVERLDQTKSMKDLQIEPRKGIAEDMNIQLRIWDTSGNEKSRDSLKLYIGEDNIPKMCLIFYDISNRKTFEEVDKFHKIWIQKLSHHPEQQSSVMIIANKSDLQYTSDQQEANFVSLDQGLNLAKRLNTLFMRSSSIFDVTSIINNIVQFKLGQLGFRVKQFDKQRKVNEQYRRRIMKKSSRQIERKQLGKQQKCRLIKMLCRFQNLKTKSKQINFQAIISKYLTTLQMKVCCEEKIKNLQTIQSLLVYLKNSGQLFSSMLEVPQSNSQSSSPDSSSKSSYQSSVMNQIKALEIMKNLEQNQITKVSNAISSFFKRTRVGSQNESYTIHYENICEFKKAYENFKDAAQENLHLVQSNVQQTKDLQKQREAFQKFLDQITHYIDKISFITKELQYKISQPVQEAQPLSTTKLMTNLLQFFIQEKSQSLRPTPLNPSASIWASTQFTSLCNLIETKQEKEIVEGMNVKDEKLIEQNLDSLFNYVNVIEAIVADQLAECEEKRITKQISELNRAHLEKRWGCLKIEQNQDFSQF